MEHLVPCPYVIYVQTIIIKRKGLIEMSKNKSKKMSVHNKNQITGDFARMRVNV
jgi:hypothetical protein